jgi:hypothetical protein
MVSLKSFDQVKPYGFLAGAFFTPVQIYNFSMLMGVFFVKNCKHG